MLAQIRSRFSKKAVPPVTDTTPATPRDETRQTSATAPAPSHFIRFSTKEQVLFAKRLYFLIKAGVSILESMILIRNQTKSKRKRRIYDTIIADVSAGQFLSKSHEKYTHIFGEFTINIIRVIETADEHS